MYRICFDTLHIFLFELVSCSQHCLFFSRIELCISPCYCYSEDICLQTLSLLFKCPERQTKELFVSPPNSPLVGILITIDDVTDVLAIFH